MEPMEICSADAISAEGLAEVLTCAQLQSLLRLHMPLHLEVLVEEALELRHETWLELRRLPHILLVLVRRTIN